MGFGHRVYKNYDPRATVMQQTVREVFDALKVNDPVFEVALQLEQMALNDPYFIDKKLFPNVDFYSGVILSAIGFPTTMFTVAVRARPHRRLGRAVERDDQRPRAEDRPPASALHRPDAARLRRGRRSADATASSRSSAALFVAMGALWFLQGAGVVHWPASSFMLDVRIWMLWGRCSRCSARC